jgi:hypothetical protein
MTDDPWTARDEARREARQEYAEDLYEERRQRNAHRCQCTHMDMPGSCPGPANCPMVDHGEPDDETVFASPADVRGEAA